MQTPIQTVMKKVDRKSDQKTLRNLRKHFFKLYYSDAVFILLVNVNMPTIVGILTFMNRINFMLS